MRFALALIGASALLSSTAHAAGFYLSDIGTRGMGRGGAFVASPDSLLAIHYNPAGLAQLKGLNAEASVTFVNMNLDFTRSCPCVIDRSQTFNGLSADEYDAQLAASFANNSISSNTTLVIPFIGASYGLPFYGLTFGIAAWGPNSGRHDWGSVANTRVGEAGFVRSADMQPGRYSGMRMGNLEANFALAVAAEPLEGLRIGASIMGFQSGNDQTLHLWANLENIVDGPEDPRFDAPVLFKFNDFGINWQVGASYELIPGLTIGSSFRGKRSINADGTIDVQVPAALVDDPTALIVDGNAVKVDLATAPIFRAGVQYRIPHLFAAEAAIVWEGWSAHDKVVVTPQNIQLTVNGATSPLDVITAQRNWQDTYSLRLGGEVNVLDPILNIVGGYFYEPTGIASANVDPSRTDFDKHGFALGARTSFFGFTGELSAMYVVLDTGEITDSAKPISTAFPDEVQQYNTYVGNGSYSGGYFLISASLSFALDPLLGIGS